MYPCDTFTLTVIWSKIEGTRSQCVSVKVTNSSRLGKGLKKGICLGKGGIKKSKGKHQNSNSSILLARCQNSNLREVWVESWVVKFLAQVFGVYTGWCWVQIWVASWVVKFWHERSVFTLGCVGYKFGLSLGWLNFWPKCSVFTLVGVGYKGPV